MTKSSLNSSAMSKQQEHELLMTDYDRYLNEMLYKDSPVRSAYHWDYIIKIFTNTTDQITTNEAEFCKERLKDIPYPYNYRESIKIIRELLDIYKMECLL